MLPIISKQIGKFKDLLNIWKKFYKFAAVGFVALKRPNDIPLVFKVEIHLFPFIDESKLTCFKHESANIIAGVSIIELEDNADQFLTSISDGILFITETMKFSLCRETNNIWAQFESGIKQIQQNSPRVATLIVTGRDFPNPSQPILSLEDLECELRASDVPFDGFIDLFKVIGFSRSEIPQKAELQISASSPVVLDRIKSEIIKGMAYINVIAAPGIQSDELRIGIMQINRSYADRKSIIGNELKWEVDKVNSTGSVAVNVGESAAVQVFISYSNTLFDRYWIFDKTKHINPVYAAHQAIDRDLFELRKLLCITDDGKLGRDFEDGIALLLGMLRFSTMHYKGSLGEWPDLLAFTQSNQLAIIECTTGIPGNEKLAKFLGRVEQIRISLQSSGNAYFDVLPIIVIPIARPALSSYIADAAASGVVIATREDIENLIDRVQIPPSPSDIFLEVKALLLPSPPNANT